VPRVTSAAMPMVARLGRYRKIMAAVTVELGCKKGVWGLGWFSLLAG
jgi:hypothetical protein